MSRGRVVDVAGKAIAAARVVSSRRTSPSWGSDWFVSRTRTPWPSWIGELGYCATSSDAEGNFAIGLPFARTRVTASAIGFASEEQAVRRRRGHTLRFELAQGATSTDAPRLALRFENPSKPWLRVHVYWRKALQGRGFAVRSDRVLEVPIRHACVLRLVAEIGGKRRVIERLRVDGRAEVELGR